MKTLSRMFVAAIFLLSAAGSAGAGGVMARHRPAAESPSKPGTVSPSVQQSMTWQNCVKEALQNNPDLVSSREKLNQAMAALNATGSGRLPQLDATAGASNTRTSGESSDTYSYGVTGKQLLFDGFKTSNDVAAARATARAARYDYDVTSSNLRLNLRTAFVDLLSAQELVKVSEGIVQRRKQSLDLVTLRYKGGQEDKGSLMTAQANYEGAVVDLKQAQRSVVLSQRRLSRELGRDTFTPILAQGNIEKVSADSAIPDFEKLVNTVPFLKELAAKKKAARFNAKSAKAEFFPEIYATASAGRSDNTWPPGNSSATVGVSVSLPLFNGGSRVTDVAKANAAYRQSAADERSGREGMIFTLAQAWTQWQDDIDAVKAQESFLSASEERSRIAQAQYSTGLISFNDWIIIEDNLVSNQKAILQAQTNAMIAQATWLQAKGVTLDE